MVYEARGTYPMAAGVSVGNCQLRRYSEEDVAITQ
jgi:hypothetical protein